MARKYLTIWIGKYISINTINVPEEGLHKGIIKATDYPMNPIKALTRRKLINVPICGNISEDTPIYEFKHFNPFTGEFDDYTVLLIFQDALGNINYFLPNEISGLRNYTKELRNAKIKADFRDAEKLQLEEELGILNSKDFIDKKLLKNMDIHKEIKKRTQSPMDFFNFGGGNKK